MVTRAYGAVRRHAHQWSRERSAIDAVQKVALAVASAGDFPGLTQRLAAVLGDGGGAGNARLWLVKDGYLQRVAEYPHFPLESDASAPAEVLDVVRSGEPLRGDVLVLPLVYGGERVGALEAKVVRRLSASQVSQIGTLVAARAQSLREEQETDLPAHIRLDELARQTDAVVATFAAEAKRLLDHDRLSVYLLTPDGLAFERFAVATSPVLPGESDVIPLEDVGIAHVLTDNRPLVSEDIVTDRRIVGKEADVIMSGGFHGNVSVPLRIGGSPIGILNFVSKSPGFYSDTDAEVAQQIADQVAVFFENLRLEKKIRLAIQREAAQDERDRLAQDLHNTIARSLEQLSRRLAGLSRRADLSSDDASKDILRLQKETNDLLEALRRALLRLRPAELQDQSLTDGVRRLLLELEEDAGIATALEIAAEPYALDRLSAAIQTAVFTIYREAIANVRRHARASRVDVSLRLHDGLTLTVEDDGAGFLAAGADATGGFGLRNIRERADSVGGRAIVTSTLGSGTSVHFHVPSTSPALARGGRSGERRSHLEKPHRRTSVIRLALVDDHALFRSGLREILAREHDIRIVGEAASAASGIDVVRRFHPDIVLAEISLPEASGVDLIRSLRAADVNTLILMMSAAATPHDVKAAMREGARGFIDKTVDRTTLIDAIRAVMRGATIFDSLSSTGLWRTTSPSLTRRELELVKLVALGNTNDEIARTMCLSTKTIERTLGKAAKKLSAKNRAHTVARALALNLVDIRAAYRPHRLEGVSDVRQGAL